MLKTQINQRSRFPTLSIKHFLHTFIIISSSLPSLIHQYWFISIPKIMASSSSISTIALMNLPSGKIYLRIYLSSHLLLLFIDLSLTSLGLLKSRKGGFIHYKSTRPQCSSKPDFRNFEKDSDVRISQFQETGSVMMTGRRSMIGLTWLVSSLGIAGFDGGGGCAVGAGLPMEEKPKLCDKDCEAELENVWWESTIIINISFIDTNIWS